VKELIEGSSILAIAIESGRLEAIKLLLQYHPDIDLNSMGEDTFMSKRNVLLQALERKQELLAEYFISSELNFDVQQLNTFDQSALHIASEENYHELAAVLIKKGLDINAKDTWGNTPLIYATNSGSLKIATLLVEAGATINIKNNKDKTAERLARGDDKEAILQLLKNGKS
jgi:ankyrin repeat protein